MNTFTIIYICSSKCSSTYICYIGIEVSKEVDGRKQAAVGKVYESFGNQ
jgi:hypothetical protein